jgi:uncharacterized protein YecT (DUF1311 family)
MSDQPQKTEDQKIGDLRAARAKFTAFDAQMKEARKKLLKDFNDKNREQKAALKKDVQDAVNALTS